MKVTNLYKLRLSQEDKDFILLFSLLEHDIMYFFKKRNKDMAINQIEVFKKKAAIKKVSRD